MKKEFRALDLWDAAGISIDFRMEQLVRGEITARDTWLNIRGIYDLLLQLEIIGGWEYIELCDEAREQVERAKCGQDYCFMYLPECVKIS